MPAAVPIIIGAATVVSAGISYIGGRKQAKESKEIYYDEQARLEQAKQEELERQRAEEERLKPWREAQTSAMEYYRKMAENPEVSEYAKLRISEEEKALNREMASKGLLFSGPAAELKQKARERIVAEETEKSKQMLRDIMNAAPPGQGLMPGTAQYDALIASLRPQTFGGSSGMYGAGNVLLGGTQAYLGYQGTQDIASALRSRGLFSQNQYNTNPYGLMSGGYDYTAQDPYSPYYAYGG